MISELNLTRMSVGDSSHAFMSLADFVSVASSRKGVLQQLVERLPDVFIGAVAGHQHLPARAADV